MLLALSDELAYGKLNNTHHCTFQKLQEILTFKQKKISLEPNMGRQYEHKEQNR